MKVFTWYHTLVEFDTETNSAKIVKGYVSAVNPKKKTIKEKQKTEIGEVRTI